MGTKEEYRELCKTESTIPMFSKDWWLDAVCGKDNWDVSLCETGNEIVGCLPYQLKRKWGFRYIVMPPLTQTLGVWVKNKRLGYSEKYSYEKKVINCLIDELPGFDFFDQSVYYSLTNWQPFYWRGFKQTTRYTYIMEDISDTELVYSNICRETKQKIRKAANVVTVYHEDDVDKFFRLNEKVYKRQGNLVPYSLDIVKRIDEACKNNHSRLILFAEDAKGQVHGALYVIWDDQSAYTLMSGADPEFRNSNAGSLLIWESIKKASSIVKKFDFDGSMLEKVASGWKDFGAKPAPYSRISKYNSTLLKLRFMMKEC